MEDPERKITLSEIFDNMISIKNQEQENPNTLDANDCNQATANQNTQLPIGNSNQFMYQNSFPQSHQYYNTPYTFPNHYESRYESVANANTNINPYLRYVESKPNISPGFSQPNTTAICDFNSLQPMGGENTNYVGFSAENQVAINNSPDNIYGSSSLGSPNMLSTNLNNIDNGATPILSSSLAKKSEVAPEYEICHYFMSRIPLISCREKLFAYNSLSYVECTDKALNKLIVKECYNLIKYYPSSFVNRVRQSVTNTLSVDIEPEAIPRNFVSFQNGILDLNARTILDHSPNIVTFYHIKANLCQDASMIQTPAFDSYLRSVTGGDEILAERILQMIGYCLTPDNGAKCLFLLQGFHDTGKSVLTRLIHSLFSHGAVKGLESLSLGENFTAAEFIGCAVCIINECLPDALTSKAVSRLKSCSGKDFNYVSVKHKSNDELDGLTKFILTTNHALKTKNLESAFEERIITIPFSNIIPKSERDCNLDMKLLAERDGIVNKAMAAYFRLVGNSHIFPGEYPLNAIMPESEYSPLDVNEVIRSFVAENFVSAGEESFIFTADAYHLFSQKIDGISYKSFCKFFASYAEKIHGAKRDRQKVSVGDNSTRGLSGIAFKQATPFI